MQSESDAATDLSWLVYTSRATALFDGEQLETLLRRSRDRNRRSDITGLLLYRDRRFLQALEGPAAAVGDLVETIGRDPRHQEVSVIIDEPIQERRFPDWAMGYPSWSGDGGSLPAGFAKSFDGLIATARSRPSAQKVRGLMDWFRHRTADFDFE